ncbi:DUF3618 domain-containing protein [Vitiosangium sp. GDMCC 1.1324]|uniref:DUF3618 domain-containing protein n=1 Tax=Vitiosangium sp. (strain GDMCC 1.1324) TaxID=2138576 RepID=UPI000D3B9A75|nr:DUF3618 domain-containing protein [Vitiosangium sp. GDMCC 1.1324]PTL77997.1 hypothetical protein DAT35_40935 [Vitiosangium sp. GDMCC 1.1324]
MAADGKARSPPLTPEQIRADIERTRAELIHSVGELREEVARRADWREWVRHRPLTCMGAAFFVGFLIGNSQRR